MADGSIAFDNDVKLSSAGLSNGGQKITNVAAGEADTDAVNVSQLKAALLNPARQPMLITAPAP